MQLRSANAIGDPAGADKADFFLSADRCRVVVLPVREAEMRCEAIPQWLLSSYGAIKQTLRDQGVFRRDAAQKTGCCGREARAENIGRRKKGYMRMDAKEGVYANNQTINGERRFGVFVLRLFVSS